jgi:hypothetical protein
MYLTGRRRIMGSHDNGFAELPVEGLHQIQDFAELPVEGLHQIQDFAGAIGVEMTLGSSADRRICEQFATQTDPVSGIRAPLYPGPH